MLDSLIVLAIILVASGYLLRRAYRSFTQTGPSEGGCSSCASCQADDPAAGK